MARRTSRGEAEIEARLRTLDPNSERYKVLAATRDFKASWVALGSILTEVRERGIYKDWGYTTFETYCRRELRIKKDTAIKLTRSFSFLRDHEPDSLDVRSELPPLDVVDLLSRARERTKVSDEQLRDIQEEIFSAEKMPTRGQVMKRFREVDPEAFRSAPRPAKSAGQQEGDVRKALLLAERLCEVMESIQTVDPETSNRARSVVASLRRIFEEQQQAQAEAAATAGPGLEQKSA